MSSFHCVQHNSDAVRGGTEFQTDCRVRLSSSVFFKSDCIPHFIAKYPVLDIASLASSRSWCSHFTAIIESVYFLKLRTVSFLPIALNLVKNNQS